MHPTRRWTACLPPFSRTTATGGCRKPASRACRGNAVRWPSGFIRRAACARTSRSSIRAGSRAGLSSERRGSGCSRSPLWGLPTARVGFGGRLLGTRGKKQRSSDEGSVPAPVALLACGSRLVAFCLFGRVRGDGLRYDRIWDILEHMSGTAVTVDLASALRAAHAAVDAMQAGSVDPCTDSELLETWRELERLSRRLPTVEARLLHEAEARGLPAAAGCRTTVPFLRGLLRLTPAEAHARVRAADAIGDRRMVTGEVLPPIYPVVAEAQASGSISPLHAAVIMTTLEKLPEI